MRRGTAPPEVEQQCPAPQVAVNVQRQDLCPHLTVNVSLLLEDGLLLFRYTETPEKHRKSGIKCGLNNIDSKCVLLLFSLLEVSFHGNLLKGNTNTL